MFFAKQLIDETSLPMTEVAISAGFASQRRFNACIREVYGRPPSELRRSRGGRAREPSKARMVSAGASREIEITLPYRPPFAWRALLGFLGERAIPGVEFVEGPVYARTFRSAGGVGWLDAVPDSAGNRLRVGVRLSSIEGLIGVRGGLRRLFDVDADAEAIDAVMERSVRLAAHVAALPGVRVPGAFDGFETAVRAILGQQISVRAATTLAGRIVDRWGTAMPAGLEAPARLAHVFPTAAVLVRAPLEEVGLTRARARTIRGLAGAVLADSSLLEPGAGLEAEATRWEALAGIGPWTAQYVAMRVLGEPDALPIGDLGLRKAITKSYNKPRPARDVERALEDCRPYRAYAAMRLWTLQGDP